MNAWRKDECLAGFEARRLVFPDDCDGPVVATLVRRPTARKSKAVLYLHGFIDYFFQAHMADRFDAEGFAFYALDLRKHGRSLLSHQHPCFCEDVVEYYPELSRAITEIAGETFGAPLLLAGHSTGGLVSALYAHEGEQRGNIAAIWLNSPFMDFNASYLARLGIGVASGLGRYTPFMSVPNPISPLYSMSLHRDYYGEWDFDLRWKPVAGFPAYFGWLRAISNAHTRAHAGLSIGCPVLSMRSDKSDGGTEWKETFFTSDIVLNVADIERWTPALGTDVTACVIPDGMHDLVLSRQPIRERAFGELFGWLRGRTALR